MERETGIEPATSSLGSLRSTAELLPLSADPAHEAVAYGILTPNQRQHLVPFRLHLCRCRCLEIQPQQWLRVRGADVEVPVRIVNRQAIQRLDDAVLVPSLNRRELRRHLFHAGEL